MENFHTLIMLLYGILMACSLIFIINVILIKQNSRGKHSRGWFAFNCTMIVFSLATALYAGSMFYEIYQYSAEPIDETTTVVLYDDSSYSSKFLTEIKESYADKKDWVAYYDAVKVTLELPEPTMQDLAVTVLTHDVRRLFVCKKSYLSRTEQYDVNGILTINKRDGGTIVAIDNFYFEGGELATEHNGLEYSVSVVIDSSSIQNNVIQRYKVIQSKYLEVMEG